MKDGISGSDKESRRFFRIRIISEYGLYKKKQKFCKKIKKMKNSVDIHGTNMV